MNLGDPGVQLADLDGDGRPDLLVSTPDRTGYWPLASNGGFDPAGYVPVSPAPTVSLSDPLVRLIDLDGDGITDALRTGDQFELFYSDNGASFSQVQVVQRGGEVPDVTFGDPRVFLADMTGDGLTDLVLVHDGNISYWPYLGYGSWGAKVVMHSPPRFADAAVYPGAGFDPRRLLLGDVDGDGCADVVYVGDGTVTVWVNQSGNGFADPVIIRGTPRAAGASIRLADMAGTGTAGVLWTYDLGTVRGSSYKFLDLTGGTKPYLLTYIDNHCGAATTITYGTSTAYAIADRAAGTPWHTTLPFPVQVVASTTVTDYFSQTTLTSEYFYHHGYWDGADREFRGFARVDQRDTLTPTGPAHVVLQPADRDPHLVPPRPGRPRKRCLDRWAGPIRRVLAGGPAPHRARGHLRPARRHEPAGAALRDPRAARPGAAQRTVRPRRRPQRQPPLPDQRPRLRACPHPRRPPSQRPRLAGHTRGRGPADPGPGQRVGTRR